MNISKIVSPLLFLLLLCSPCFGATYYIDHDGGADTNNGTTTSTPWAHCPGMTGCSDNCTSYSHSNGDKFVFKGGVTWGVANFPLTIANSGGSGNPDIYTGGQLESSAWGSGYPVFDGEDLWTETSGFVALGTKSNITLNGIKVIRAGNVSDGSGTAILLNGSGITISNMWLETNAINAIAMSVTSGTYSAIYINDNIIKKSGRIHFSAGDSRITDFRFYNNIFYGANDYDPKSFHTDGLMIGGDGVSDYAIQNLYIYNNRFIGNMTGGMTAAIYLNGTPMTCYDYTDGSHEPTINQVIYGEVTGGIGSKVYIVTNTGGWEGAGAGSICVSGTLQNGEHLHEAVDGGGNLIAIVASTGTANALKSTKTAYIYNNLIGSENSSGTTFSPAPIYIAAGHDTVKIYNNTVDSRSSSTAISHCIALTSFVSNADIKNNILTGCDNGITLNGSGISNITADYNLFYTDSQNHLLYDVPNSSRYNTCETLQGSGYGTNYCAIADPTFVTLPTPDVVGSGNWNLQASSPAIGNGVNLGAACTGCATDIAGTVRGAVWDIGAYEYQAGSSYSTHSFSGGSSANFSSGSTVTWQ